MPTPQASLQAGDILLHMGKGEISKLIAWAGSSDYSHAALVIDVDTIAEAVSVGARTLPLKDRLAQAEEFRWIDAFRPSKAIAEADLALVRQVAKGYLGVPYPLNELFVLGVVCAVRDKLPQHPWARLVVRLALDHVVNSDPKAQVCSEYVYRCFAEAATRPPRALAPRIVIEPPVDTPFPDIDWLALWKEYEAARQHSQPHAVAASKPTLAGAAQAGFAAVAAAAEVGEDELRDKAAAVRARLAASRAKVLASANGHVAAAPQAPLPDPLPNPKTVLPADLASSPSFAKGARVLVG